MKFYTSIYRHRNQIYVRGFNNDKRFTQKVQYKPYLFIPAKPGETTKWRSLQGTYLNQIRFDSMTEARNFIKEYDGIENFNVYGSTDWECPYIYNAFPGDIDFDPKRINVGYLDIETDKQVGGIDPTNPTAVVTAITIRKNKKTYVFGYGEFKAHIEDCYYVKCDNENMLLYKFLDLWEDLDLDVITGWNIEFFDIPYLVNRIKMLLGDEASARLSPWGMMEDKQIIIRGKENQVYVPVGVAILDYQHLYKKFSFKNSEDWKLNTIAHNELGEKKVDYSAYQNLFELYEKDHQKFIEYNIHDVVLVEKLEEQCGFIEQVFYLAYDAKVNYNDTLATVRPWDFIIHNFLMDKGIVVPPKEIKHMDRELVGGYVKEVEPGMYKWVVSFDFDSLYPHIIMLLNIGPDTYLKKWSQIGWSIESGLAGKLDLIDLPYPRDDIAIALNLCMYRKDFQGFLSELMQMKYDDRTHFKSLLKKAKKKLKEAKTPEEKSEAQKLISKYHNLQMARKIQLNSAYGALGNQWFRWFDLNHAEAITMTGQFAIQWVANDVNSYLNKILKTNKDYVIASDTDSLYVTLDDLVSQIFSDDEDQYKIARFVDKICKDKIQGVIEASCQRLYKYLGAHKPALKMKRESIASKGMWVAKKLYILNVLDNEGEVYEEPTLKMMGISAVKSSTPAVVRDAMKKTFSIMMNKTEEDLHSYVNDFKKEFVGLPFESIAFPRGVKNLIKYRDAATIYKSATPQHVRAALMYNKLLDDHKLSNGDREKIYDGDKIKYGYLKRPNPSREDVIAILNDLPKEFGLDSFIDYERQFQKTYLEPINEILGVIGWHTEKKATLEDFF